MHEGEFSIPAASFVLQQCGGRPWCHAWCQSGYNMT